MVCSMFFMFTSTSISKQAGRGNSVTCLSGL